LPSVCAYLARAILADSHLRQKHAWPDGVNPRFRWCWLRQRQLVTSDEPRIPRMLTVVSASPRDRLIQLELLANPLPAACLVVHRPHQVST
jgi:hypothetical protein